ncbi:MAG TPA: hypothetical protein VGB25_03755 [Candidatus Binatia bacterium]
MERERVREREPELKDQGAHYEATLRLNAEARERARTGKIVIKAKERPMNQTRMGCSKQFLSWHGRDDTAATDWTVFIKDLRVHSGKHRHQGGIQLFILEGEGSTEVDGKKVDWEKWDLIVLPVKPNGCEHQHFSKNQGAPCRWMAFRYAPYGRVLGNMFDHLEDSSDWENREKVTATLGLGR